MSITRKRVAAVMAAATALVGTSASAANAATKPSATPSPSAAHRGKAIPYISRANCGGGLASASPHQYLQVIQSNYNNVDCFAFSGSENVDIYNIDQVWTGNNGVTFTLYDDGQYWGCWDAYKGSWAIPGSGTSCESAPYNDTTMVWLDIYPGIN